MGVRNTKVALIHIRNTLILHPFKHHAGLNFKIKEGMMHLDAWLKLTLTRLF